MISQCYFECWDDLIHQVINTAKLHHVDSSKITIRPLPNSHSYELFLNSQLVDQCWFIDDIPF